jgi:enoyl-CoA hydratase/carnithine racemase
MSETLAKPLKDPGAGPAPEVLYEVEGGIATITLNRPERMNAMAFDVMIPFRQALEEIHYDNDTRVVIVTGAGHGFCSGADLTDSGRVPNNDPGPQGRS